KALNIATLIDFQAKDQQTIENLWRRKLIERKNVLTFAKFTGSTEADIEDMFGDDFYLRLVNGEYTSALHTPLATADIGVNPPRVLVRLSKYLAAKPLAEGTTFNHYRPARYLTEHVTD